MPTSATRRWKPARSAAEAPDWPWSVSIVTICSTGQPNATAFCRSTYWRAADSVLVRTCRTGGLAHIQVGTAGQVARPRATFGTGTGGTLLLAGSVSYPPRIRRFLRSSSAVNYGDRPPVVLDDFAVTTRNVEPMLSLLFTTQRFTATQRPALYAQRRAGC